MEARPRATLTRVIEFLTAEKVAPSSIYPRLKAIYSDDAVNRPGKAIINSSRYIEALKHRPKSS